YFIDSQPVQLQNVREALTFGIALIHQELNLASNLDLAANIFLGREVNQRGFIQEDILRQEAKKHLTRVGLDLPTDTITGTLPIGKQQLVEIAKALSCNARVLIMDEPTSSLSQKETETLFEVVKGLRADGISVIYISHRLGEVKELADRVTVFRDGENAGDLARDEIDHNHMVRLMVGRDLNEFYNRTKHKPQGVVLSVKEVISPTYPGVPVSMESGGNCRPGGGWSYGITTDYFWSDSRFKWNHGDGWQGVLSAKSSRSNRGGYCLSTRR
ncbi:MAG: ATP-binding cassette domain-containing protein, partial [Verrucomicrobiia bacterium]